MSVRSSLAMARVLGLLAALGATCATPAAATTAAANTPPASVPLLPADKYLVRLSRPWKVGDKFAYTADATVVQTMTANNAGQVKTYPPRSISVHLEATEHVLAVSPRGEPTRVEYTVIECTAREGRQQVAVVQPGRVVTVEATAWKPRINVDQGAFTIQDELTMRAVVSVAGTAQASDDECFGTEKAQGPGDTWPARPDGLVRSYAAAPGLKVKKQNVSGTMKLAGIETVDGVLCMKVQGKTKIEHFFPPATDLPEGSRVQDATSEYKFTKVLPVDQVSQPFVVSHSSNVLLKLRMNDATIKGEIPVDCKLLRTVGIRRKRIGG